MILDIEGMILFVCGVAIGFGLVGMLMHMRKKQEKINEEKLDG